MSLTATAIAQKVLEALRDSADILDECQDRFGKAHSVFSGFTGEEAPGSEYQPYFQIYPAIRTEGEEEDKFSFTLSLELGLQDSTLTEATSADGVYTAIYRGPESLEVLLNLARDAIRGISAELEIDQEQSLYDPLEFYPLFVGILTLTITFPKLIGGYEPTL